MSMDIRTAMAAVLVEVVAAATLQGATVTPWKSLQSLLNAGGTVRLENDVTVTAESDATLTVTNAVTLDLNGHTLDANGRFNVIKIASGGNLTLTNSFEGAGTITGGSANYGGGVIVNGGTFTMAGGTISGNTSVQSSRRFT